MPMQFELNFETAERGARACGDGARAGRSRSARACAPPLSELKREGASAATLEEVAGRLERAFEAVAANKGAGGPDGQSIAQVRENLSEST